MLSGEPGHDSKYNFITNTKLKLNPINHFVYSSRLIVAVLRCDASNSRVDGHLCYQE